MIVAGAFALLAQSGRRKPDERMEPVHRAADTRDELREEVVPLHVRQLMQQHVAPALRAPFIGVGGDQDRRPANAPSHRHRGPARLPQPDVPRETELERQLFDEQQPALIPHRRGDPIEPRDPRQANGEQNQDRRDPAQPDRENERGPVRRDPPAHAADVSRRRGRRGTRRPRDGSRVCSARRGSRSGRDIAPAMLRHLVQVEGHRDIESRPAGDAPIREQRGCQGQYEHGTAGESPHQMTQRSCGATEQQGHAAREQEDDRRLDEGISENGDHVSGPPSARRQ